jgi:hypothetical protein
MIELPSRDFFNYRDCVVAGDPCWLITPKDMGVVWTDANARFRSCVVRQSNAFVVSQGYRKFTNMGEQPEFEPWDSSWPVVGRRKIDGSLLIVSKYRNEIIVRTRGNINAYDHQTGEELRSLFRFEKLFDRYHTANLSYLFEWTSPSNIIVIRESDKPQLTLLGCITNDTAEYAPSDLLKATAEYYGLTYPEEYTFENITDAIKTVKGWSGKEGIVIRSPDSQTLKKIKADEYCKLHKIAHGYNHVYKILDLFFEAGMPDSYEEFYSYAVKKLDYEIAERIADHMNTVCDAYTRVKYEYQHIKEYVDRYVRSLESRREQAAHINITYKGYLSSFAFSALDNKEPSSRMLRASIEDRL